MKASKDIDLIEIWNKFILDGNMDALSHIYLHYYDCLFDYGHKLTTEKQLVEDAIQDMFINFIKFRKSIGSVKNLTGYLICTFRRQLFHDVKKNKKTIPAEQLPEEHFDYFKSPDKDISDKENLELLHLTIKKCIGNLPTKQQEIMYLRFEREISYEEIAVTLSISVESCYKSVYRSVKTIRSEAEKILGEKANIFLCILFGSAH
jgi:RNA polymerase sigma factor (sigma-70 family)